MIKQNRGRRPSKDFISLNKQNVKRNSSRGSKQRPESRGSMGDTLNESLNSTKKRVKYNHQDKKISMIKLAKKKAKKRTIEIP